MGVLLFRGVAIPFDHEREGLCRATLKSQCQHDVVTHLQLPLQAHQHDVVSPRFQLRDRVRWDGHGQNPAHAHHAALVLVRVQFRFGRNAGYNAN